MSIEDRKDSTTKRRIFVSDAHGIGWHIAHELSQNSKYLNSGDYEVRVGARQPSDVADYREKLPHVAVVLFDWNVEQSYAPALQECATAILLLPYTVSMLKAAAMFIEECVRARVEHVVYVSLAPPPIPTTLTLTSWHSLIESTLANHASRFSHTIVRVGHFMEDTEGCFGQCTVEGQSLVTPFTPDTGLVWISVRDVARVCANIAVNRSQHVNQCYNVSGVDLASYSTIAERVSSKLSQSITVKHVEPKQWVQRILASKNSEFIDPIYLTAYSELIDAINTRSDTQPVYSESDCQESLLRQLNGGFPPMRLPTFVDEILAPHVLLAQKSLGLRLHELTFGKQRPLSKLLNRWLGIFSERLELDKLRAHIHRTDVF